MSEPATLGLFVAFAAGVLSFLSPCVLPLVPSYIGFLTGMSLPEVSGRRRVALVHALLFVLGFSLVFVLLGASATALGRALNYYQVWLQRIGGVLIIGFGLVCLGVIKVGILSQERRVQVEHKPVGYLGSMLVGMAFGAGWTPCIGPVLGAILGLAATIRGPEPGNAAAGGVLGGAGGAVPDRGVGADAFLDWFQRFRRYLPWVMRVSGVLLVFVGVLMVTGEFTRLAGWLQQFTPEVVREKNLNQRRHLLLLQFRFQLLPPEQLPVPPAAGDQVPVRPLFDDPTFVQHQNPVGVPHRGQPMGDDDARPACEGAPERAQDLRLGLGIHRAQGVIEDEHRRVLRQGARDGAPLLLAAREIDAPLAEHGVEPLGERGQCFAQLGDLSHALEPAVVGRARAARFRAGSR